MSVPGYGKFDAFVPRYAGTGTGIIDHRPQNVDRHTMSTISERVAWLRGEIGTLESRYARPAGSVTLIGISKTHPSASVREGFAAGLRHFGESYVQEALPKIAALSDLAITWHFVGRIQGNKTAGVAATFDWVHSIDRLRIAQRLNDQRPSQLPPLNCCLEVRLSAEQAKGGVEIADLDALAAAVMKMPRLRLRGLMALPAPSEGLDAQREPFKRLAGRLEALCEHYPGLDTLSMGMSDDLEAAIAEGATMVRIGTALFGERRSQ